MNKIVNVLNGEYEPISYSKAYTEQLLSEKDKEIERLNNIINLIKNNIDITMQIIKEQPTENDEWILERLNGIKNIDKELKEGKIDVKK